MEPVNSKPPIPPPNGDKTPSSKEEAIHQLMHPGTKAPKTRDVPSSYVWEKKDVSTIVPAVSGIDTQETCLKMMLTSSENGFEAFYSNPYTKQIGSIFLKALPKTSEELKGMLQKEFRRQEKAHLSREIEETRVDAIEDIERRFSVTGRPPLLYEQRKRALSSHIGKKIDEASSQIELISPFDLEKIKERVDTIVNRLKETGLKEKNVDSTKSQLMHSLVYIHTNRRSMVAKAKKDGGSCYIRPVDQGTYKNAPYKMGGTYLASHLYVSADGTIFLIPKHSDLKLGKGTYKVVHLAIEEKTGNLFAIASVRGRMERFESEVSFIQTLLPYTVHAVVFIKGNLEKGKMILPFAKHRTLDRMLRKHSPLLQQPGKKTLMKLIAEELDLIHQKGIICHDIKAENILFGEEDGKLVAWIRDLGLARFKVRSQKHHMKETTEYVMAPEGYAVAQRVRQKRPLGRVEDSLEKVDIFALGVTLWDLYEGHTTKNWHGKGGDPLPWCSRLEQKEWLEKNIDVQKAYKKRFEEYMLLHPQFEIPDTLDASFRPKSFEQLLAWMTHWDPKRRPTAAQVAARLESLSF